MAHTKRELLHSVAEKLGGEHGVRLRAVLQKKTLLDDILDRPISDDEFETQLKKMLTDFPKALERMKSVEWEKPGTWGFPN